MIKFLYEKEESTLVGLGISEENVRRLKDDQPIVVKLSDMGITTDIQVLIFYGKDEKEMEKTLRPYIGEKTKISLGGRE